MMNFQCGQNAPLPSLLNQQSCFSIQLTTQPSVALNFCAFLLNQDEQVSNKTDVIFYNQLTDPTCAVKLDPNTQALHIDLACIPAHVERIAITASLLSDSHTSFSQLDTFTALVKNQAQETVLAFDLKQTDLSVQSLIIFHLYLHKGVWKIKALGDGFKMGLDKLKAHYGCPELDLSVAPTPPAQKPQAAVPSAETILQQSLTHTDSIEIIRSEILRLIQAQLELHHIVENDPDFQDKNGNQAVSFADANEILKNEYNKVEHLEMTLAVVGTMKAGKSTSINAIVGHEVLPNRNQPMTTLPTLIRHVSGQKEPKLTFQSGGPIREVIQQIHQHLRNLTPEQLKNIALYKEEHGRTLIHNLQNNPEQKWVEGTFEGPIQIFDALCQLNDVVRLCQDKDAGLDITFPFEHYKNSAHLPLIEVEFAHLPKGTEQTGRFTLLDTPGPNEAGHNKHLRRVLAEQLERASAVLVILDYTQLKSEAEASIKEQVQAIYESNADRIYALVNKFDQRDRNGMNEIDTKAYVSQLFDKKLDASRVFPVSSRLAFLSNRARYYLKETRQLPLHEMWVNDFMVTAFGGYWKKTNHTAETMLEAAETLWEEAGFQKPLDEIVINAKMFAWKFSAESALSKLKQYVDKMIEQMDFREQSLSRSHEELAALTRAIQNEIDSVRKEQQKIVQEIKEKADEHNHSLKKKVEPILTKLKDRVISKMNRLKNIQSRDRYELEDQFADFTNEVDMHTQEAQDRIFDFFETVIEKMHDIAQNKTNELNLVCGKKIGNHLKAHGFSGSLEIELLTPEIKQRQQQSFNLDNVISSRTEYKTRMVKKEGFFGGTARFFGSLFGQDDWGYEEQSYSVERYEANSAALTRSIESYLSNFQKTLDQDLKDFQTEMIDNVTASTHTISNELDQLCNAIDDAQEQKRRLGEQALRALQQRFGQYKMDAEYIKDQMNDVKSEITTALKQA